MSAILSQAFARPSRRVLASLAAVALIAIAVGRVHVRVQTTLMGYEIGRMKNDEAALLEERSLLKMQLAKLTTKKHLMLISEGEEEKEAPNKGTLALQ